MTDKTNKAILDELEDFTLKRFIKDLDETNSNSADEKSTNNKNKDKKYTPKEAADIIFNSFMNMSTHDSDSDEE